MELVILMVVLLMNYCKIIKKKIWKVEILSLSLCKSKIKSYVSKRIKKGIRGFG